MNFEWKDIGLYSNQIVVNGVDAISQAIYHLTRLERGDIVLQPEIGSVLEDILFEPMDEVTASKILYELTLDIQKFDPRLRIVSRESSVVPIYDENKYDISLVVQVLDDYQEGSKYNLSFLIDRE